MEEIKTKICNKCREEKLISDFEKNRNTCKPCWKESKKKHIHKCLNCGSEYRNAEKHSKFCCTDCYHKFNIGENNHRYNSVVKKCSNCNKDIEVVESRIKEHNFCDLKCHGEWISKYKSKENSPNYGKTMKRGIENKNCKSVEVKCSNCDKVKMLRPSAIKTNNFCSQKCKAEWQKENLIKEKNPNWTGGYVYYNCDWCGSEHSQCKAVYDRSKNHFCSQSCKNKWRSVNERGMSHPNYKKVETECHQCKKIIFVKQSKIKKQDKCFCSPKCNSEWQKENFKGEKNPFWNPNITDEERIAGRFNQGYKEWRKSVFERDNYTCQCCGDDSGGNLNAHHLNGYNWCIEGRTDINNGITLCEKCHSEYHSIYRKGNNTMLQYFQFMATKKIFSHYQESVTINEKWIKELEL